MKWAADNLFIKDKLPSGPTSNKKCSIRRVLCNLLLFTCHCFMFAILSYILHYLSKINVHNRKPEFILKTTCMTVTPAELILKTIYNCNSCRIQSVTVIHQTNSLAVLLSLLVITEIRSLGTPFCLTTVNWDKITYSITLYLEEVKFEFLQ